MLSTVGSAIQIGASFSGLPFAGGIGILVKEICDQVEAIKVHKQRSKRMGHSCATLLNSLSDQQQHLTGSELQAHADQLTAVLEKIRNRVRRWSQYSRPMAYIKRGDVEDGLAQCEHDLQMAMSSFNATQASIRCFSEYLRADVHLSAQIVSNHNQRDAQEENRRDAAEVKDLLFKILTSKDDLRRVVKMQENGGSVAESFMEDGQRQLQELRQLGESSNSASVQPDDIQHGLIKLHRWTGIPPSVKILDNEVTKIGELPLTGGVYSDIWLGKWLGERKVALKSLRNIKASNPQAKKRFEHEVTVWAALTSVHILPFYGIATNLGPNIHMVSPWQDNGNVLEYVKHHPDANRICLLLDAAKGLEYLHSKNIIHGNVKCTNILVKDDLHACICDFGMSKVVESISEQNASFTLTASGSTRWLAPELIEGSTTSPTKQADVYSFSMACLELITGKQPWYHKRRDAAVIHTVMVLKMSPPRPGDEEINGSLPDELWELMTRCWAPKPELRPHMVEAVALLQQLHDR